MRMLSCLALLTLLFQVAPAVAEAPSPRTATRTATAPTKPPFRYVWGTGYHILPETHSDESGYFSIIEGLDGKIYIGTAKYNFNGFLVEFDPRTSSQKIVIDTNKVAGLSATGYAAESKIHTRNFVGPSGIVYCGSQEGYRKTGDTSQYPGGYVMTYDPHTGVARSLGMPMPGKGVLDVVADEARGLLYVVTSTGEDNLVHWLVGDIKTGTYRPIGPLLTPYASTLMDKDGRAHAITNDFHLATYDPKTGEVSIRDIILDGVRWTRPNDASIPTWQLTPDHKAAYLILMNDPTLLQLDLQSKPAVHATNLGLMVKGKNPDSRSSLTVAPDCRVYVLVRVDNDTGFGSGYLHHLARYNPRRHRIEDLGVLAVRNPTFFDFGPRADGTKPPWSHGYHTLPDGTLTPLHGHQGLIATRSGTLYALILYPYTLLQIPAASVR